MKKTEMCPYFFPSTTLFVDDDKDFLLNFSLQLEADLAYRLYNAPQRALKFLNQEYSVKPLAQRCFRTFHESSLHHSSDHVICLNLSDIHKELYNKDRFAEVAVIVVDFAMPGVNGLEFCREIKNKDIKKILLTGKADEQVAIQAFNEGSIDRYIRKSDPQAIHLVNRCVLELQEEYLHECSDFLLKSLSIDYPGYLSDLAFVEYFEKVRQRYRAVEYYLSANPQGFLLLNAEGQITLLVILSKQDLEVHYEIARDEEAPEALLNLLKSGEKIPYFVQADGYYRKGYTDWEKSVYAAQQIQGRETYYCAIIENPQLQSLHTNKIVPYAEYLETLDAGNTLTS